MAETTSIASGVALRYASALFELALEAGAADTVGADLDTVDSLLKGSADLQRLVRSPVFTADEQVRAITAVLAKYGVSGLAVNFLSLVARNRRLFALSDMIGAYRAALAVHRGEATAEVASATALSPEQVSELKAALKGVTGGKDIKIVSTVDPSLLGGLVVKVGSRMIDTSLKTKLSSLKVALKEVR